MSIAEIKIKDYVERKVRLTIKKYNLAKKTDKIAVAASGGKDSTAILYILKKLGYKPEAVSVDVTVGEYTKTNIRNLTEFCGKHEIPLHILSFRTQFGKSLKTIKSELAAKGDKQSYCMICGILKRFMINRFVKADSYDAVATGHNLDDESQAFIMNVFRNDYRLALRQGPMPGIVSGRFIRRIKPLYFISEEEAKRYSKILKFPVNYERCPHSGGSFRANFREMLNEFEEKNPSLKYNIVRFQEQMKKMADYKVEEIGECSTCGEPTGNEFCKACGIIKLIS